MKSQIFNLIILDESGSMQGIRKHTISGCNETINTIRATQEKFSETQEHFISIYVFQGDGKLPSRYIIKNVPADKVSHITADDYVPYGNTPLYDAVGSTLSDLKATVKRCDDAVGSVTIITDGMENSSSRYSHEQVAQMIAALKELGWNFNFIGANIDVEVVSRSLNIDNSYAFEQNDEGTRAMFETNASCSGAYFDKMDRITRYFNEKMDESESALSEEDIAKLRKERTEKRKSASKGFFKFRK